MQAHLGDRPFSQIEKSFKLYFDIFRLIKNIIILNLGSLGSLEGLGCKSVSSKYSKSEAMFSGVNSWVLSKRLFLSVADSAHLSHCVRGPFLKIR